MGVLYFYIKSMAKISNISIFVVYRWFGVCAPIPYIIIYNVYSPISCYLLSLPPSFWSIS